MVKAKKDSRALSSSTKLPQIIETFISVLILQFLVKSWGQRGFRRGRGGDTEFYASQVMINLFPEVRILPNNLFVFFIYTVPIYIFGEEELPASQDKIRVTGLQSRAIYFTNYEKIAVFFFKHWVKNS